MRRLDTVGLLTLVAVLCAACATPASLPESTTAAAPSSAKVPDSHGIRFESLRLSGSGLLVDFRYKVVDPLEAKHVVNRNTQPFIVDPATGHEFRVPHAQKVGTLRHMGGKLEAGRSYSMLFANPGRTIASGAKVNLVVGSYRLEGLTVE
jgi:hypothetical protein